MRPAAGVTCDVLLVRLSALGDVVHALDAMHALARARPAWRLHLLVQREFAPLFRHLDWLAAVVEHERAPALRGWWRLAARLRRVRWAMALDLQGNWKSALAARTSGARHRIGAASAWRREPGSACLLTQRVPGSDPTPHPARIAFDVVRAVAPDAVAAPALLVASEAEMAAEAAALRRLGLDASRPLLVLVLGRPADNRSWPAAFAAATAARSSLPAVVLSGPREPADLPLPPGIPRLHHGDGELRRLVALGCLLARTGGRVLGPDQGPVHVLAGCGAEVSVLFGPQDPARTAPLRARVLVRPDGPSCVPCRRRVCHHPQGPVCMRFAADTAVEPRSA
jgi:ADP-heptose:LPS heptosyltransferase